MLQQEQAKGGQRRKYVDNNGTEGVEQWAGAAAVAAYERAAMRPYAAWARAITRCKK